MANYSLDDRKLTISRATARGSKEKKTKEQEEKDSLWKTVPTPRKTINDKKLTTTEQKSKGDKKGPKTWDCWAGPPIAPAGKPK